MAIRGSGLGEGTLVSNSMGLKDQTEIVSYAQQRDLEKITKTNPYTLQDCVGFDPERHTQDTTADYYDEIGWLFPESIEKVVHG